MPFTSDFTRRGRGRGQTVVSGPSNGYVTSPTSGPPLAGRPAGYSSDSDNSDNSDFEFPTGSQKQKRTPMLSNFHPPSSQFYEEVNWNTGEVVGPSESHANWLRQTLPPIKQLQNAIVSRNVEEAKKLFHENKFPINDYLEDGRTLLLDACSSGACIPLVNFFISVGADVSQSTPDGFTCLMAVADGKSDESDAIEVTKLLISLDANVNAFDVKGLTCLMIAVKRKLLNLVRALLDSGALIDQKDTMGRTALIIAAEIGFGQGVRLLIERGADLDHKAEDGNNAYHAAVAFEHEKLAEMLGMIYRTKWRPPLDASLLEVEEEKIEEYLDARVQQNRTMELNQIDMLLERLNFEDLKNIFTSNHIQYTDFIRLTDENLTDMGVHPEGRIMLLNEVQEILNRDWANARDLPCHLQKNITPAEGTCLVLNIKNFTGFLVKGIEWILLRSKAEPKMFEFGLDVKNLSDVVDASEDMLTKSKVHLTQSCNDGIRHLIHMARECNMELDLKNLPQSYQSLPSESSSTRRRYGTRLVILGSLITLTVVAGVLLNRRINFANTRIGSSIVSRFSWQMRK